MRSFKSIFILIITATFFCHLHAQQPCKDSVMQAMIDEITRCHTQLKTDTLNTPYYLSAYVESTTSNIFGYGKGILIDDTLTFYKGNCELRYGDFDLDHSNFSNKNSFGTLEIWDLSDTIDYWKLRESLWRGFEQQYANNSKLYNQKKQLIKSGKLKDTLRDFIRSPQILDICEVGDTTLAIPETVSNMVKDISAYMEKYPDALKTVCTYKTWFTKTYFYNSEGSKAYVVKKYEPDYISLNFHYFDAYNKLVDRSLLLPLNDDWLQNQGKKIKEYIDDQLRQIIYEKKELFVGNYLGPVMIEGEAVRDILNGKLLNNDNGLFALREIYVDDRFRSEIYENKYSHLSKWYGRRAFPKDMQIVVGNQRYMDGIAVPEFRHFDIEGIVPKDSITLVSKGIIQSLISTRIPTQFGTEAHGYTTLKMTDKVISSPSFVQFNFTNQLTVQDIKNRFIEAIKDEGLKYGIIVRAIKSVDGYYRYFNFLGEEKPIHFDNVYMYNVETGKETPIYGVFLKNIQNQIFLTMQASGANMKISIDSDQKDFNASKTLYKYPKAILFDHVEIQKVKEEEGMKPVVPMPAFKK